MRAVALSSSAQVPVTASSSLVRIPWLLSTLVPALPGQLTNTKASNLTKALYDIEQFGAQRAMLIQSSSATFFFGSGPPSWSSAARFLRACLPRFAHSASRCSLSLGMFLYSSQL